MEKATGIPLKHVWDRFEFVNKLQIPNQISEFMKAWLSTPMPGYGSLYYANDIYDPSLVVNTPTTGKQFSIGPATGRDWVSRNRGELYYDRGPCKSYTCNYQTSTNYLLGTSALEYRKCIGDR